MFTRKKRLYLIIFLVKGTLLLNGQESWILPHIKKKYNEITFLASHNAYASKDDGWRYSQQKIDIEQQLSTGVRGFLLDIHFHKNTIVLSHGGCRGFFKLLKTGSYDPLQKAFNTLLGFLEQNPHEIITIFLENYVHNDQLKSEIEKNSILQKILLTKKDWDPEINSEWPTLEWMQKKNKRIIIFNEDKSKSRSITDEDPFFSVWHHIIESQYGTTNLKQVCKERRESQLHANRNRSLYLLNFFGTISLAKKSKKRNSYEMLKQLVDRIHDQTKKLPNWIALDFVDQGNAMKLVNELNQQRI
ncbi:MAG: hypothetical protein WDZ41_06065 [Candidatus Babeliales bacterium]